MPVFRSLLASSLVLVLAGAESFGQPAPTCKEPIVLGGEPPIVRRQSAANLANHIQSSPCLPFPHPGGELYFSWKPPRPGNYLIAVRPIAGEANVTLALWRGCPGANGSCLAGADAAGPGEPEAMQVRGADGGPNLPVYTIIVDSSVLGAPLDEVEVRIEELATPDVEVADARAPHPQAFQLALQSFQSVWEADQQRLRVLGVASRQALDALAVQGVGVRSVPVDRSPVQATPVPEPPNLRFDRFRYDLAGLSKAHLYLDVEGGELPNPPAVHVAGESDDVEAVKLVWDGQRYHSTVPLLLTPEKSGRFDGRLAAKPGHLLVAFWQDPRLPGDPAGTALALAMVKGRAPLGLVHLEIDPKLSPPAPETPGRSANEPPRPLGAIAGAEGAVVYLGADQLVYQARSAQELQDLLERHGARVVQKGEGPAENPHLLVRFDPGAVDLDDLEVMLELLGAEGEVRLSSPEMLPLLALFAEESLRGAGATPNFLVEYAAQPETAEGLRPSGARFDAFGSSVAQDCLLGLQRSWAYVGLFDREREDGHGVRVAVIDSNFCPFPDGEVEVAGGHNFVTGEDTPFGTGSTFGVGGAFHGTQMASLVGGRHANLAGAAGSGGQVAELFLYNLGGLGYLFESDAAIRRAVRDGARVINLSWTIPCKIFGINFCKPRHFFRCLVIVDVVGRAAVLLASLGLLHLPPGTGVLACGVLVGMLSSAHNQLEDAVAFAEDSDVVIVASAGNPIGPFGPSPVERFQLIPPMFESVVTVGATDEAHRNTMFFGRAVDVWVRELMTGFSPRAGDGCPPFEVLSTGGTSTSAALTTGVVALMRAVNPDLTAAQIRGILRASTVDTPGGDPRVRAFLRADRAVMTAGALAGLPDPTDPAFRFPSLGFDEEWPGEDDVPRHYGPAGSCLGPDGEPWPAILRPANDGPGAATRVPLDLDTPGLQAWGQPDGAIHGFTGTPSIALERDWYFIPRKEAADCEVFDIDIAVEWPRGGGALWPETAEVSVRPSTVPGAETSETTVRLRDVWMHQPLAFEVVGDDNLYELEVRVSGRRYVAPDRFEPGVVPGSTVLLPQPGLELRETRSGFWRTFSLEVPDLNFHCPDDLDYFLVTLPEADETCLELEMCDGARPETFCAELRITGADDIRVLNMDLEDVTPPGTPLVIPSPRTAGLSQFFVEFRPAGRQAKRYSPLLVYRVPRSGADAGLLEELDDWACCALQEMRDCHMPPDGGGDDGRFGRDYLDLARIAEPAVFSFDVFCPVELCDPPPTEYHLVDLRGHADPPLELFVEAGGGLREDVAVELVDLDYRVVARGEMLPAGAGGANAGPDSGIAGPGRWRIGFANLAGGIYFLRVRGLERGEVYTVEAARPLPSLEPAPRLPAFRRADANGDARVDISDAVSTLGFLFLGSPTPLCPDAADANDDDKVDLSDSVTTLNFLFLGGAEPPAPGPRSCGSDPTPSGLGECKYLECGQ